MKKKVLMLESKVIDTINNSDIYMRINLYLSEKECEGRLFQVIQSANSLKKWVLAKDEDGKKKKTVATLENLLKKIW